MASKTALAIALLLTANTGQAASAIGKFTNDAHKKLESLKQAATWDNWGNNNIKKGAIMAAPIIYATAQAAKLESKIADVAKVVDVEIGSKAFTKLSNSAMEAAKYLGNMPGEVAELMAELAAGGTAAEKLDKMAIKVGKIGVAFDVTAGEAGKSWMTIQNAMNATEEQTATIMDAMNAATNRFGGKASALMQFMAEGGASVSQTLRVSGVKMQAFGNALQTVGISASESATTMERFQQGILGNAEAMQIFNKAGGGANGMLAILEKAKNSGSAFNWLRDHDMGQYSTKLAQLANNMDGTKGLRNQLAFLSKSENVVGSSDKEYDNRSQTTEHKFNQTKVAAFNNALKLGQALLPVANQLMVAITPIIEKISLWITANPQLAASMMKVALAFAAGRMALGGLQKGVGFAIQLFGRFKGVVSILKVGAGMAKNFFLAFRLASTLTKAATGLSFLGRAFSALRLIFISNPIGLIITGIATAAYLIIKNWSKIKPFFANLFNSVWTTIKGAVKIIAALFINFTPAGLIYKNWGKIKGWFSKLWQGAKNIFLNTVTFLKNLLINTTPVGLIYKHWEPIKKFFSSLWDGVKNIFSSFVEWLNNSWVGKIINKIASVGKAIKSVISSAGNSSLDATVNKVGKAAQAAGVPTFAPAQPTASINPVRNSNSMVFSPTIQLSGRATEEDAQMIAQVTRSQFEQMMKKYNHDRERRELV